MVNLTFDQGTAERQAFISWCSSLGEKQSSGSRSQLRRCSTADEAMLERSVVFLCMKLGLPASDRRVGMMAMLAARATHFSGKHPAEAFATPKTPGGGPVVSELRFRRILGIEDRDELLPLFRRAMVLADGKVDLGVLAQSLWFWGDRTRREWADAYYRSPSLKKTEKQ